MDQGRRDACSFALSVLHVNVRSPPHLRGAPVALQHGADRRQRARHRVRRAARPERVRHQPPHLLVHARHRIPRLHPPPRHQRLSPQTPLSRPLQDPRPLVKRRQRPGGGGGARIAQRGGGAAKHALEARERGAHGRGARQRRREVGERVRPRAAHDDAQVLQRLHRALPVGGALEDVADGAPRVGRACCCCCCRRCCCGGVRVGFAPRRRAGGARQRCSEIW
ncbi:hypothetical protein JKP88DRAFT_303527 [Tribonema minus]|uniref:Uncharacterized protein n=1 Tax=Tribonema minus TaxID=303371 RepID=A0A836CJH8_9STRA|nr:hypothetical protein JKP88DRAFT_303527 [Tribonema minus]